MSDFSPTRVWSMRVAFGLLVCTILFFNLLPLDMTPSMWVGPDMLLCFTFAWALRRPEFVPMLTLAALFLLADLLLQRPPGLWALCALIAAERLKARARAGREANFLGEWLAAAAAIIAVALLYRMGLALAFLPLPPFGAALLEVAMTIAFYPLAALVTHWALGVRRAAPGEADAFGGGL